MYKEAFVLCLVVTISLLLLILDLNFNKRCIPHSALDITFDIL